MALFPMVLRSFCASGSTLVTRPQINQTSGHYYAAAFVDKENCRLKQPGNH
jgi:hypothetical protein